MINNFISLSLGSNLGDRKANIIQAVELLIKKKIIFDYRLSKIIETDALLLEGSPKSWDIKFLNAVMCGFTNFSPIRLLSQLKEVERTLGRDFSDKKWAPRTIDIDILFYNDFCINNNDINIPHPEFLNRRFLVKMMAEISPGYLYPNEGNFFQKKIVDIYSSFQNEEVPN